MRTPPRPQGWGWEGTPASQGLPLGRRAGEEAGGRTQQDEVVLFELMTESLNRPWWANYRVELEGRFRQKALVVRALAVEGL